MGNDVIGFLFTASTWVIPVLLAITLHEAAHGFVAWLRGDPTAYLLGRVSANPIRHIDPFGTVILPVMLLILHAPFLFGWAKPVPVQFGRLRNPKRDMVWVALAGPGSNILMAYIAALGVHTVHYMPELAGFWAFENFRNAMLINLVLAVFNMIPIPPLDGGRVAVGLLPQPLSGQLARLERVGMLILIGVLFILPMLGDLVGIRINLFAALLHPPIDFLSKLLLTLAGHDLSGM